MASSHNIMFGKECLSIGLSELILESFLRKACQKWLFGVLMLQWGSLRSEFKGVGSFFAANSSAKQTEQGMHL